jgi:ABC-2 type transport system ATP-binding protein
MRVRDFLEMMCKLRGVAPSKRSARLDHALQACALSDHRARMIGRLSRGLRRRVGLAQAIVHDPEVIILDEPTAGLDPAETRETHDLIKSLGRQHTMVVSSHVLPEVAATCGRILIIDKGRLVADDTPARLVSGLSGARGHEVKMLVRGSPIAIEVRMRAVDGADDVVVSDAGDGLWRVTVTASSADVSEELARAAVEAGFGLLEMQASPPRLEELFLRLATVETA